MSHYVRFEDTVHENIRTEKETYPETETDHISDLYTYYYSNGFCHAVLARLTGLLTFIFLIAFSFFLFCTIDYDKLLAVTDQNVQLSDLLRIHIPWYFIAFFSIASLFALWETLKTAFSISKLWKVRKVYHQIGVSDNSLEIHRYTFEEVYEKYMIVSPDDYAFDDALNILLQRKNFQLAIAKNVMPEINDSLQEITENRVLKMLLRECMVTTKVAQWYLKYGLWYYIFIGHNIRTDVKSENTNEFNESIRKLRVRMRIISIIGLIGTPFVISYLFLHFAFKIGTIAYDSPGKLMRSRSFSIDAKGLSRVYGELDHEFEERLPIAADAFDTFLQKVNRPWWTPIAKFVTYVSGTLLITTFVLNLLNDNILLNVFIGEQNILQLCAILGIIFAMSNTVTQRYVTREGITENFDEICETLRIPSDLDPYSANARKTVITWYPLKLELMARECLGILITPFVILFIYVKYADTILRYIRRHTVKTNIGDIFTPIMNRV